MSLYQMQKFLFDINRDPAVQKRFLVERTQVLSSTTSPRRNGTQ